MRVPLILKLPRSSGPVAAREIDSPVTGLDVVPTLLHLAGVTGAETLAGRSLLDSEDAEVAFVHGTSSFPDLEEERFRLDLGSTTVVFDRVRGQTKGST